MQTDHSCILSYSDANPPVFIVSGWTGIFCRILLNSPLSSPFSTPSSVKVYTPGLATIPRSPVGMLLGPHHLGKCMFADATVASGILSVQFSHSVMFDSLQPHGLQHARPLCPSPTPRAYSNLCPSHQWCHPTISSSVVPFSSHLQLSQHQGLFQWVISSQEVARVLGFQLQHQSFQWLFRTDFL